MADARSATVGEDATFSGRFRGHDLVVLGRLEGDVELKGSLRVGKQGHVKAKVKAASVDIEGEFEGEVRADTLSLADTARSKGTFIAKRLNVREGAILEGAVNPAGSVPGAAPAPATTAPQTGLTPVPPSAPTPAPPAAAPATPGPTPPSNPQGGHKPEGGGHPGA
jgi:cytoskeletal protein CcmA (bactofilin family)